LEFDFRGPEWAKLAKLIADRLERQRVRLEDTKLDSNDTAVLRGRVAELRELLALPELTRRAAQARADLRAPSDNE
jgi:hypothetical protein